MIIQSKDIRGFIGEQRDGIEHLKDLSAGFLFILSNNNPALALESIASLIISDNVCPYYDNYRDIVRRKAHRSYAPASVIHLGPEFCTPIMILLEMSLNTEELERRFEYLETRGKAEFLERMELCGLLSDYPPHYAYLDEIWGHKVDDKALKIIRKALSKYMKIDPYKYYALFYDISDEEESEVNKSMYYYDRLKQYRVLLELCHSPYSEKVRTMYAEHLERCESVEHDMDLAIQTMVASREVLGPYMQLIQIGNEATLMEYISSLTALLDKSILSEEDIRAELDKEWVNVDEPILIPIEFCASEPTETKQFDLDIEVEI